MTEPKSPREIAETIVGVLDPLDKYGSKGRDANIAYVEQALVSYAAERERLLADADQVLDAIQRDEMGGLYDGNNGELFTQACERHRLRSRPATEGKREDE